MRLAFLTSCLEPGRDGVGDYTALLAGECARRGHETLLTSVNDRFAAGGSESESVLRLGPALSWKKRIARLARALTDFDADVVSVQFVPYGFDSHGMTASLAPLFEALLAPFAVHLFFHELWIGDEMGARLKDRAMGWMQRVGIDLFTGALAPRIVHTSNGAYLWRLSRMRIAAEKLPLFGSLPLPEADEPRAGERLEFVMFGALHAVWPPEPILSYLREAGKPARVTHVGHIGAGEALWDSMRARHSDRIDFERLGPLAPDEIAAVFARMDFGIATTPWLLIEKSATAAAMLEAGLPVIVNRDDIRYRGMPEMPMEDPYLIRMDASLPDLLRKRPRRAAKSRLPEVAERFLAGIGAALE